MKKMNKKQSLRVNFGLVFAPLLVATLQLIGPVGAAMAIESTKLEATIVTKEIQSKTRALTLALRPEEKAARERELETGGKSNKDATAKELRKWEFNGCKTVEDIVNLNWPCHPRPVADPEGCKSLKQEQIKSGICRHGLAIQKDQLKTTGKTQGLYFHQRYSGYKKSGPFVELQDKAGNLWWVTQFDWQYANETPIEEK